MLGSVLGQNGAITVGEVALCMGVALVLGLVVAGVYMFRNRATKSFVVTLALLPVLVQSVILVVNGNLGAGVAVMGAFSLIRFRSVPGGAKEILTIFYAMAVGLICGMGYVVYAAAFALVVAAGMLVLGLLRIGEDGANTKSLRVTIPEDMDYTHLFDDLFSQYTRSWELQRVRTTNLGGLYELQYTITLKDPNTEKQLLDKVRQRNGNLTISCGIPPQPREEL